MATRDPITDVQDVILGIVRGGIEQRPDGVHMTYIGAQFAKIKELSFEQYMGFLDYSKKANVPHDYRKLLPFITHYLNDNLEIFRDSETGSEKVRLRVGGATKLDTPMPGISISSATRFKKPVWAAFVRPLPDGFRRFMNIEEVSFKDASRKPNGPEWIEVESSYIVQTPVDEAINGPLVQAQIGQWANDKSVDVTRFVSDDPTDVSSGASLYDLVKIVRALPLEVTQSWALPVDVLRHLKLR